jgi:nicotinamidase-related amidase
LANESDSLQIDKKKSALVVIDLQKGIASMPSVPHDTATVIGNAARLAESFRRNQRPVILVNVMVSEAERLNPPADTQPWRTTGQQLPKDWAEFVPELEQRETDIIITKKQWGAFYGTDLDLQLRRRNLKIIVLCGIATNLGVESTARFAYEHGYQQIFAEDAMAARSLEEHSNSINFTLKRIGRVRTTEQILAALK